MKRYRVSAVTTDVSKDTTFNPEDKYGGWFAINQGAVDAYVMGYKLQPGEGLDMRDACPVGCIWDTAIQVRPGVGGLVRITRLQARPIEDDKNKKK